MMRKQLSRAFDAVVVSHYDFAEASYLTAVEEDEAYNFVRDIRGTFKEVYLLIDSYCHPEMARDSGLGSTVRSQPTEMSERKDTRFRFLNRLQQMQIQENEERQRLMQLKWLREEQDLANIFNRSESHTARTSDCTLLDMENYG